MLKRGVTDTVQVMVLRTLWWAMVPTLTNGRIYRDYRKRRYAGYLFVAELNTDMKIKGSFALKSLQITEHFNEDETITFI